MIYRAALNCFAALFCCWAGWLLAACAEINTTVGPTLSNTTGPAPTLPVNRRLGYTILAGPVARVDGVEIKADDFNQAVDEARASAEEQAGGNLDWQSAENKELLKTIRLQSLEGLINYQVVAARAALKNVAPTPAEIERRLDDFKKQMGNPVNYQNWLARRFISEADHRRRLAQTLLFELMSERHSSVPDSGEQVRVRHILVQTETEARSLFQRLQSGADFLALARQFSLDPVSAAKGGELDWIFRGQTDATFENAAFALLPNSYSGPVRTDKGYHLIQLVAKEVRPLPFDLVQQRRTEAFSNYIKGLREAARIEKLLVP